MSQLCIRWFIRVVTVLLVALAVFATPTPVHAAWCGNQVECPENGSLDLPNGIEKSEGVLDESKVEGASAAATAFVTNLASHTFTTMFKWLDLNTDATVNQEGSWFVNQYGLMAQVGIWVLVPLLLISLMQAVAKGDLRQALLAGLVYLPISILGTVVAVQLVQLFIVITDEISDIFLNAFNIDLSSFGIQLMNGFATGGQQAPWLLSVILGFLMIGAAFSLLFILVMREATIYIGTLFLPLMFAMLVWPYTARYFRGMIEFLVSIIFSKVVIVSCLALAVAGLAATQGIVDTSATSVLPDGTRVVQETQDTPLTGSMEWFAQTMAFIGMLFMASFAPWMVQSVVGHMGLSETGGIVTTVLTRAQAQPFVHGVDRGIGIQGGIRKVIRRR